MRETLDGFQGGLEIGGRMITNVRYADRLDRVSRKYSLLINVHKTERRRSIVSTMMSYCNDLRSVLACRMLCCSGFSHS